MVMKKAAAKKSPAKKTAAKKSTAKRAPAKKTAAKKSTAKRAPAKKTAAKKSTAKRAPAKKTAAKKSTAKKTAAQEGAGQADRQEGHCRTLTQRRAGLPHAVLASLAGQDGGVEAICDDLAAEHADLDRIVADADLAVATPAAGWTVADQLSHLWFFDQRALLALTDPAEFSADAAATAGGSHRGIGSVG